MGDTYTCTTEKISQIDNSDKIITNFKKVRFSLKMEKLKKKNDTFKNDSKIINYLYNQSLKNNFKFVVLGCTVKHHQDLEKKFSLLLFRLTGKKERN